VSSRASGTGPHGRLAGEKVRGQMGLVLRPVQVGGERLWLFCWGRWRNWSPLNVGFKRGAIQPALLRGPLAAALRWMVVRKQGTFQLPCSKQRQRPVSVDGEMGSGSRQVKVALKE
jgi:hypothetical protein